MISTLVRWSPERPIHTLAGYARNFRDPNQTPTTPISRLSQLNQAGWRAPAVASIIDTSSGRGPAAISGGIRALPVLCGVSGSSSGYLLLQGRSVQEAEASSLPQLGLSSDAT